MMKEKPDSNPTEVPNSKPSISLTMILARCRIMVMFCIISGETFTPRQKEFKNYGYEIKIFRFIYPGAQGAIFSPF